MRHLFILLFLSAIILTTSTHAADLAQDVERLSRDLENLKTSIETRQTIQKQNRPEMLERRNADHFQIDALRRELDRTVDKVAANEKSLSQRLNAQDSAIDRFLSWAGWIGVFLTIFITIAGLLIFPFSKDRAKKAADDWMKENGSMILDPAKKLAEKETEKIVKEAESKIDVYIEKIKGHEKVLGQRAASTSSERDSHNESDRSNIESRAITAQSKAPIERTYDDWYSIGLTSLWRNNFPIALDAFSNSEKKANHSEEKIRRALLHKGIALSSLDRHEEANIAYNDIVDRFKDTDDIALKAHVAWAFNNIGWRMGGINQIDVALIQFEKAYQLFHKTDDPKLLDPLAQMLLNKAIILRDSGKYDEANSVFSELIKNYENSAVDSLKNRALLSKINRGYSKICFSKSLWNIDQGKSQEQLISAIADCDDVLDDFPDYMIPLINRGYAHFLQNPLNVDESDLRRALELGGVNMRDGILSDTDIHPVPIDPEFKILVNRLWNEIERGESSSV